MSWITAPELNLWKLILTISLFVGAVLHVAPFALTRFVHEAIPLIPSIGRNLLVGVQVYGVQSVNEPDFLE